MKFKVSYAIEMGEDGLITKYGVGTNQYQFAFTTYSKECAEIVCWEVNAAIAYKKANKKYPNMSIEAHQIIKLYSQMGI